ncbi:hypothetical protein [Streptomyces lutosisoli]|uniref:Uncharacterized protein n=1 Tax=Streptomyces lutosisoli TaxID=2665721 RepID=A0ABW2VTN1_9ACTN
MGIDPRRYPNPAAGYHRITCERRFMYIEQAPVSQLGTEWLQLPVTCPMCGADAGLTLVYERGGDLVQVLCPNRHEWPEPLVPTAYFVTYSEQKYYADPHPDLLWIIDAGFGEEPPPPITDHVEQLVKGYKEVAKYAGRKGKTRIKRAVRKPVRKAKKKALNLAFSPVAAVLRAAWIMQSGAVPQAAPKRPGKRKRPEEGMKVPSAAAYRKAYGMAAPAKGPACLVCEDSGRITAPGVSIPCTECAGPAAAAMAAAEKKAERARSGAGTRRARPAPARTTASRRGVTVRAGETVTGPVSVTGPTLNREQGEAIRGAAREAVARGVAAPGAHVNTGVVNIGGGRITGSVQTIAVTGDHQGISVRNDGRSPSGGRPPTAEEAALVRDALATADRAVREAGSEAGGSPSSTVHVAGDNNSVITTVTNGDAVHITGDD